jgi:5-methylcytosine-specific restriction protein A
MPRNNRYYLEVNHVVPFASESKAVDVLDNLVKLCPTCHRALAPHRAEEKLQREIIEKMIVSRPEVSAFVGSRAKAVGQLPSDYIFANLK